MRFVNPLIFVKDMARSKQFYVEVLGLEIVQDHGDFVQFDGGFAIHEGEALQKAVWQETQVFAEYGRRNCLFYFEHDQIDALFARIGACLKLIHGLERQHWGQRVFRFYDPDGHAIEIGETQKCNP